MPAVRYLQESSSCSGPPKQGATFRRGHWPPILKESAEKQKAGRTRGAAVGLRPLLPYKWVCNEMLMKCVSV